MEWTKTHSNNYYCDYSMRLQINVILGVKIFCSRNVLAYQQCYMSYQDLLFAFEMS